MAFNGSNQLTNRYLYGPGIDMILADEAFNPSTANFIDTYWTLADHQPNGWRGNGQGPAARDALGVDRAWGTIPETRSPAALATNVLMHNAGTTTVAQQLAYTAFGSIGSIQDGQGNDVTTGPISRFAYTGREFDPETGNYFYRARYYDPQTGRFLSQDPPHRLCCRRHEPLPLRRQQHAQLHGSHGAECQGHDAHARKLRTQCEYPGRYHLRVRLTKNDHSNPAIGQQFECSDGNNVRWDYSWFTG